MVLYFAAKNNKGTTHLHGLKGDSMCYKYFPKSYSNTKKSLLHIKKRHKRMYGISNKSER